MFSDAERYSRIKSGFEKIVNYPSDIPDIVVEGRITRTVGLTLEAVGCRAAVGSRCLITVGKGRVIESEVVGFHDEKTYLMPVDSPEGIMPNARVVPTCKSHDIPVGMGLLGRVIDGAGRPLDGLGAIKAKDRTSLSGREINPFTRAAIDKPIDVGVRAINSLFTVGRGQRMGLFAGSGVGKSSLLGMMAKYTSADVTVVGLIGERGREIKDFVQNILGKDGLSRSVVVASPADETPLNRLHGAMLATSIAEYFRDQGLNVLLLMDSLTRFAQAQREIALAVGEPPATKGYPPSVFAKLPHLVERAGNGEDGSGSVTAFYTVLVEGDDHNDPISDASRAILDGHIVLSRRIAESGRYPAIDVEASISRVMVDIASKDHMLKARKFREIYSIYERNKDLISVGAYRKGADPKIDESIAMNPHLSKFLQQEMSERIDMQNSISSLDAVLRRK